MTTTIGSGVGSSVTIGKESVYGTFATPTRGYEHESESLEFKPTRTTSKSIYNGGLVPRASGRQTTTATVDGDVVGPVFTKGMGLWLGLICGTLGISPVQQSSTTAYLQTHTLGENTGQSASIQVGRPTMDGTVNPYSYLGCVATKAVFEAKVNEPLRMTLTIDGKDVTEAQAYTAPTYQTANPPLFWNQGQFQMGAFGSEALVEGVRSFTLTIERKQKTDLYYLDGSGRKGAQPVRNDYVSITGDIETDFNAKANFADVFYNDTPKSIIVPFTGSIIASTFPYEIVFKMPRCYFNSEPPKVAGLDIIQPKMQFQVEYDDSDAPFTILYQSTDTTL